MTDNDAPKLARSTFKELSGLTFGRLTVLSRAGNDKYSRAQFMCRCECGVTKVVRSNCLLAGETKSCGCVGRAKLRGQSLKHGLSRRAPEYRIWIAMKSRCVNKNNTAYQNYGGRGIRVCEGWLLSFETFYAEMGPRPSPHHSIDRVDSNSNYEVGNCRWATRLQQNNNTRSNKKIQWDGRSLSVSEIYRLSNPPISKRQFSWRLNSGWELQRAISTPPQGGQT